MEQNKKTIYTLLGGAAGCIVLYFVLHETDRIGAALGSIISLVQPFLVGACIAFSLSVPMRAIERQLKPVKNDSLRRGLAILLTFLALVLVLAGVVYLLVPQIQETVLVIAKQLPPFFEKVEAQTRTFLNDNPEMLQWLRDNTDLVNMDWGKLVQDALDVVGNSVTKILNSAVSAVGSIAGAVVDLVIGLVFALYCLAGKENLARQGRKLLYALIPERAADQVVRVLRLSNSTFSNFLAGQCIEVTILGAMFAVAMLIFKMPYVTLVSVLVAVTAFVPLVGAFVGCALGAFFILVTDPMQALWFVVMFLVLQQIEGNLIYPRVVGNSIGLPGMWVLVAVSIGGDTMGIVGMLLMIPLSSVVYALVREFTASRLERKGIAPEKITPQPPELTSKRKEKRQQKRAAREAQRLAQLIERTLHPKEEPESEEPENEE